MDKAPTYPALLLCWLDGQAPLPPAVDACVGWMDKAPLSPSRPSPGRAGPPVHGPARLRSLPECGGLQGFQFDFAGNVTVPIIGLDWMLEI